MKIYLAGPDVFRPDAISHGKYLSAACKGYGFEGLYPLDNQVPKDLPSDQVARWIYESNIGLIMQADIVVANLNFFRGAEPDSGTCWEIGYAVGHDKPVYGYLDGEGSLFARMKEKTPEYVGGWLEDHNGWLIENFSHPVNLMLACSAKIIVGDINDCLYQIHKDFDLK